ncbi:MAG: hypothetical protein PHO37_01030 [Kiritimatiellae bacterium]|nr:hypothetical protein [Kiritimatiellia bacterium]
MKLIQICLCGYVRRQAWQWALAALLALGGTMGRANDLMIQSFGGTRYMRGRSRTGTRSPTRVPARGRSIQYSG